MSTTSVAIARQYRDAESRAVDRTDEEELDAKSPERMALKGERRDDESREALVPTATRV